MNKEEFTKTIIIPNWLRDDKYEWMTQEEFTKRLTKATKTLALSIEELEEIKIDKIGKAELRAILTNGI